MTIRRDLFTGAGCFCPGGALENSPAIYRWERNSARPYPVPEGRLNPASVASFSRPSGTIGIARLFNPAINRWAIVKSPSGTSHGTSVVMLAKQISRHATIVKTTTSATSTTDRQEVAIAFKPREGMAEGVQVFLLYR